MPDYLQLFDGVLAVALVAVALGTLLSRELFQATVMFIFFGMIMAIAWCRLDAIDVALAEAAIGSGLTGALLLNTLAAVRRHRFAPRFGSRHDAKDVMPTDSPDACGGHTPAPTAKNQRQSGLLIGACTLLAVAGLAPVVMTLAAMEPTVTEPRTLPVGATIAQEALPIALNASLGIALADSLPPSGVDHPVTAVLLNFRAYDTLLEVAVLLAAVLAVLPVTQLVIDIEKVPPLGSVLATFIRLVVPLAIIIATYVLWSGTKAPGGAFQAAAILAAVAVLLILAGVSPPHCESLRWRLLLIFGLSVFLFVAVQGMFAQRRFLEYHTQWAGITIMVVEVALTISIALILTMLFSCTLPASSDGTVATDAATEIPSKGKRS